MKYNLRDRLRKALNAKKWYKTTGFNSYIGCTLDELKIHFEKQFKDGMTWQDFFDSKIHIDHIIPLSSAKTEEELIKLCHYTNLQPLWAEDNLKKSDKMPEAVVLYTDKNVNDFLKDNSELMDDLANDKNKKEA